MVDKLPDFAEEDLGDSAIVADYLDSRLAEWLRAAQIVDSPANTRPVFSDNLDLRTVKETLQLFHHCKEVAHRLCPKPAPTQLRPAKITKIKGE